MRLWLALIAIFFAGAGTSIVSAQEIDVPIGQQKRQYEAAQASPNPEIKGDIDLFSNRLGYYYPNEWVLALKTQIPEQIEQIELIPFDENVRDGWTQKLLIQGVSKEMHKLKQTISPEGYALIHFNLVNRACPGAAISENLGSVEIEGGTAHRFIIGCIDSRRMPPAPPSPPRISGGKVVSGSKVSAQPEEYSQVSITQATKRHGDMVIVRIFVRGLPKKDGTPPLDKEKRDYFISLLDRLEFSDNPIAQ